MDRLPQRIDLNPTDPDVFCPEWWTRIHLIQNNDAFRYKPCCLYRDISSQSIANPNTIYHTHNQSAVVAQARQDNLNGVKNAGCAMCYESEQRGITSSRQYKIQEYGQQNVPVSGYLDLNLGNLCNLSCAICGPWNSTNWAAKAPVAWGYERFTQKYLKNKPNQIDDPELFLSLHTIQLQGGEVFLEPDYYKFFSNMGKYRTYDNLRVIIFTNGTVKPSAAFWDILNQCGQVEIFFSIDDIKQRFEYQRDGAQWDQVVENMHWFQDHAGAGIKFNINPTYSMLNIYYLADLHDYLQTEFPDIGINYNSFNDHAMSRAKCQASAMTAEVRQACIDRVQHIPELDFLSAYISISENQPYTAFLDYIRHFDQMSKKSYAATHPEFYQLITQ
jgi:hypothetical protein